MNAPTGKMNRVEEIDSDVSSFYRLRSEMLDNFADIEKLLLVYVTEITQEGFCPTAPLGHKIEIASKVPAGPQRSKELKKAADLELSKLAELMPARADMVHSRMIIAIPINSQFVAIFKNAKDVKSQFPEALVFEKVEFENFVAKLNSLE